MPTKLALLELHGYKTFAQKTVFDFPSRVTAIVGPNGSGKSNVADAIRWVLGEQSYSLLRAKKTEDMIYNGSDQRARAGMASVSITFNNEENWLPIDYSEVVLTRRAYRDGTNEYLLNNQRVRLKDFYELLAKTGLSERTYTIIGQGLVDLALSIRPDERGKLFEEAAGIGLYRTRKEEALKRLETTKRNLERAQDIMDEIKPHMHSLEKQATRAREYRTIQESLQSKLHQWYGYHWYKAQEELAAAKAELEMTQSISANIQTRIDTQHGEIETLQEQIESKREIVNHLQEQLSALHSQIQEKDQELAILEEREHALKATRAQIELDMANLEETIQADENGLATSRAELAQKEQELVQLQEQFSHLERTLTEVQNQKDALDSQYSQLQKLLIEAEKEAIVLKSQQNELIERLRNTQKGTETNQKQIVNLQNEEENAERAHNELLEKLHKLEENIQIQEQQRNSLLEKQTEIKHNQEQALDQINRLNLDKNKLANQLDLLRQAQQNFAGYSEGAKTLLKNNQYRQQGKVFIDLVSRLEVPEQYERAITAALGEAIDLLVLQDQPLNQSLLHEIETGLSDKVALFTERPYRVAKKSYPAQSEIKGIAAELVKSPEPLEAIIEQLLGEFLVIDNLDSFFNLSEDLKNDYHIVTLDGEVFLKNGVTFLGKARSSGKVSYSRRTKELEAEIKEIEQALEEAKTVEANYIKELSHYDQLLAECQTQIRNLSLENEQLLKDVHKAALDLDKITNRKKWLESQIEESARQISQLENELQILSDKEEQSKSEIAKLQFEIEGVKQKQASLSTDEIEQQFRYMQMEVRMLQQSIEHEKADVKLQQERLISDQKRRDLLMQRKSENEKSQQELHDQKEALRQAVQELTQRINALGAERLEQMQAELKQLETASNQLIQEEENYQKELALNERQVTHFQLEYSRKQERLESLRSRIEDDFGLIQLEYQGEGLKMTPLPFDDISLVSFASTPTPPETTETEIKDLKAQLRRIGVVNIEAEKEYQEIKERYDNLATQISDLEAAIADIQRIIKELDDVMERDFLATFKAVNAEFSRIFTRLFNGGAARLTLTDTNSPIEGGIEIEARLPGRREQGLVLLSGGERSLTAVALVFALLKISPTPFCILDEVDAMMDESNVGRFIELIKDLSADTQFLLITHNRNTVQAADVIYGVTMGKDGASQVMSLRLEDVNEEYLK